MKNNILTLCSLVLLVLFYVANLANFLFPNFLIYPSFFSIQLVRKNLQQPQSLQTLNVLNILYAKDPEVQSLIGDQFLKREMNDEALKKYKIIIDEDPKNEENQKKLATLLINMNKNDELIQWFFQYAKNFLPSSYSKEIETISLKDVNLINYEKEITTLFDSSLSHEVRFARLLYKIGLDQINKNNQLTEQCWQITTVLEPNTSQYYVELAGFYNHILSNPQKATEILEACIKDKSAQPHCQEIMDTSIPLPGSFYKDIVPL